MENHATQPSNPAETVARIEALYASLDDGTYDEDSGDFFFAVTDLIDTLPEPERTDTALAYSICPMHLCDYAICFDDENPECAALREANPGHDT